VSTFLANAELVVITSTSTDRLGDVVDDAMPILPPGTKGIPASVLEKTRKVYVPESDELRTVRWYAGRVSSAHASAIPQGARLYDLKSGRTYIVDETTPAVRSIMGAIETTLDLRRVEAPPA
jgi:hypothetical protein